MSQIVKNNRGFLQLLAHCPTHQCEFLLMTATPQQVHALVQVLYNVLKEYIPFPEENRQKLLSYKDGLISLAERDVPYKKEKHILVQEGGVQRRALMTNSLNQAACVHSCQLQLWFLQPSC